MSGNSVIDKQDARPAAPATKAADDPVTPVFGNGAEKSIFGENGERLTGREAEDYAVTAIKRFVHTFSRKLEQLAKKDISLERAIGALGNARSISNKENLEDGKKKKEEYESAMRTALRHAQKALEEQLDALNRKIEAIDKKIEVLKEEISDTENQLRKEFGENWKEKFKKGEVDKDHPLYQQWLLQQQQLNFLQAQRDELRKAIDDARKARDNVDADQTLSDEQKTAKIGEIIRDLKEEALMRSRAIEMTEGSNASGFTLGETANPLQEKLGDGAVIEGAELQSEKNDVEANSLDFLSIPPETSITAKLEGDGSYTRGVGKEGLSSKDSFNAASHNKPLQPDAPDITREQTTTLNLRLGSPTTV